MLKNVNFWIVMFNVSLGGIAVATILGIQAYFIKSYMNFGIACLIFSALVLLLGTSIKRIRSASM